MVKSEHRIYIRFQYCINVEFPEFDNYTVVIQVNALVFRRYMLKYLGLKGHDVHD